LIEKLYCQNTSHLFSSRSPILKTPPSKKIILLEYGWKIS